MSLPAKGEKRAMQAARPREENLTSAAITTVQLYAMAFGAALAGLIANQAGLGLSGGLEEEGALQAAWVLFAAFALAPAMATVAP